MKVVIAGGSGFIGSMLVQRFCERGDSLALLSRKPVPSRGTSSMRWQAWQPGVPGAWGAEIDGADGVVSLAGEGIAAKRWTERQKELIRSSRIDTTSASVPASVLTLVLGEMADMLLAGQRALPEAARKLGYNFKYSFITEALESLAL